MAVFIFLRSRRRFRLGRWPPGLSDEGISFAAGTTALSSQGTWSGHCHPHSEMKIHFGKSHVVKENVLFYVNVRIKHKRKYISLKKKSAEMVELRGKEMYKFTCEARECG